MRNNKIKSEEDSMKIITVVGIGMGFALAIAGIWQVVNLLIR